MNELVKQKILKIYELAEKGVAGEREAAKLALDRLMKKHNLTEEALSSLKLREYTFKYASELDLNLFVQLMYYFFGEEKYKIFKNTYGVKEISVNLEHLDFVQIETAYGYFKPHMNEQWRKTTIGSKVYYPNLIQGMLLHSPSQVWQSDITYIEMDGRFYYAVFIIDIYTKEIVGHNVSDSLRATANLEALKKALKKHKAPMIHHSDKGSQYIYKAYISGLNKKGCQISMCDSALDNAYAERINQTIKNEYINRWKPQNYKQLKKMMDKAVEHYNTQRPHNAIGRKTPMEFRKQMSIFAVQERPKVIIYADGYRKPERGIEPPLEVCKISLQAPNCPIVISQTKNSKSNLNSVNTI
ncbi:transposase [Ornithobacterium rhinotracheale]|uniref:transposase n=1 Tax=Ornithobacterium rhinotracheale TaxID=28251 RepID=UPI004035A401